MNNENTDTTGLRDVAVDAPFKNDISYFTEFFDPINPSLFKSRFSTLHDLLKSLHSSEKDGISSLSVQKRIQTYGTNEMPPPKTKKFLRFLFDALKERMVVFLLFAAGITVAVGVYETIDGEPNAWLEGAAIIIAIAVISGVNSVNDWRKQARFKKLNAASKSLKSVKILRDGVAKQVPTEELVVGDVMQVSMGDVLPCDGILFENHYVKTDESSATGESDQIIKEENIEKDYFNPFMLSGTTVVDGSGKMIILAVGRNSLQGKPLEAMSVDPEATPLQKKLGRLAKNLATGGFIVAVITLAILLALYFIKKPEGDILDELVAILLVGISIIVMAIPEGLPLAVTLSLAYATIHMLKDKNLVRHLSACETMGGATTICSDKTGTLTVNKMKIVSMRVFNKGYDRENMKLDESVYLDKENFPYLAENISINSEAYEAEVKGEMRFIGSKTDIALLEFLMQYGYNYAEMRESAEVIEMIPFSSERKRMTTRVKKNGGEIEYIKGASEIVLDLCTHYVDKNGSEVLIDQKFKTETLSFITEFAKESLRTICCAYKKREGKEDRVVLLSLFGIEDPLRDNAAESVERCKKAGVVVRMVTGDNALTAKSIATQCGIVTSPDDVVIEGPEFRELSEENMQELIPKLRVMARSSPTDKLLLVKALQKMGETVAVTGDGANDGPALKVSDVGFSMGLSGTEVAKEASDIVLLDDNFESIVKAIMWGRAVYSGIQKFLMFQLAINISAVLITVITALQGGISTGRPLTALTTLQILMINLISDSLAAMALSTDKPDESLLKKKPHRKSESIITGDMYRMIFGQSLYQISVGLLVYYIGPKIYGGDQRLRVTMVFNTFVYMALFNELNCRSVGRDYNIFRGITKNKFFIPLFVVGLLIQFPVVTYLGVIFDTVPLKWWQWLVSISLGTGSLIVGVIIRSIDRLF